MTVPRWDAEEWHTRHTRSAPRRAVGPRVKLAAGLAAVALCLGAAAVSATTSAQEERVGICHATGSAHQPYVHLEADRNGYEHGHHRHHAHDFFVAPGAGCDGDVPGAPDAGNGTGGDDGGAPAPGDAGHAGGGNDTAGEAGDDAQDGAGDNSTTPEPIPAADAWVRQSALQQQDDVVLSIAVGNRGDGAAGDVSLASTLPDLRRAWHLGGADPADCTLTGLDLSCWFGPLAPGDTRTVELRSYTDRMPCGQSLTSTAQVTAADDAETRNNASSASILARAC